MSTFPRDFPVLSRALASTWGGFQDSYIKDPKLKAIVSALWGYFGLPPSRLASIYYAMPTIGYLSEGGYYPVGRSQKISNALARLIQDRGGKVLLGSRVASVMIGEHAALGVRTVDGAEYRAKVVVSNANAYDTFHEMMDEREYLKDYLARLDSFSVSLSSFQVFLGLKKDLVREVGITESEILCETGYDSDESYSALLGDVAGKGLSAALREKTLPPDQTGV